MFFQAAADEAARIVDLYKTISGRRRLRGDAVLLAPLGDEPLFNR